MQLARKQHTCTQVVERLVMANSLDVGPIIFGDPSGIVTYLQGKQLLAANKTCACGTAMNLGKKSGISDGLMTAAFSARVSLLSRSGLC